MAIIVDGLGTKLNNKQIKPISKEDISNLIPMLDTKGDGGKFLSDDGSYRGGLEILYKELGKAKVDGEDCISFEQQGYTTYFGFNTINEPVYGNDGYYYFGTQFITNGNSRILRTNDFKNYNTFSFDLSYSALGQPFYIGGKLRDIPNGQSNKVQWIIPNVYTYNNNTQPLSYGVMTDNLSDTASIISGSNVQGGLESITLIEELQMLIAFKYYSSSRTLVYSYDGVNWNNASTPFTLGSLAYNIKYLNGVILVSNTSNSSSYPLIYSTNGINYYTTGIYGYSNPRYINGKYYIGYSGNTSTNASYKYSTNGINWTDSTQKYSTYGRWSTPLEVKGRLYSFRYGSYSIYYSNDNGTTWTALNFPQYQYILYTRDDFIKYIEEVDLYFMTISGTLWYSNDGLSWNQAALDSTSTILSGWITDKIVDVESLRDLNNREVYEDHNGAQHVFGTVEYFNGKLYVGGNTLYNSIDGINWTYVNSSNIVTNSMYYSLSFNPIIIGNKLLVRLTRNIGDITPFSSLDVIGFLTDETVTFKDYKDRIVELIEETDYTKYFNDTNDMDYSRYMPLMYDRFKNKTRPLPLDWNYYQNNVNQGGGIDPIMAEQLHRLFMDPYRFDQLISWMEDWSFDQSIMLLSMMGQNWQFQEFLNEFDMFWNWYKQQN